jgi:hypothetical protein
MRKSRRPAPARHPSSLVFPPRIGLFRHHPALFEALTVGGGLLAYFLTRGRIQDRHEAAQRNAAWLVRLEQRWGLFWEPALNAWTVRSRWRIRLWNLIYFWAHAPLIAAGGLWLYRRERAVYELTRNAFLGSAIIGLTCYRLFPVAPPRLAEGYSFVDTMQAHSRLSYQAQSMAPFVNPYAAVPSLHFGWSFLLSVALVIARPRAWWAWLMAVTQPVLMFVAIVATANHWVLDAVAGLVACLAGLGGALAHRRRKRRRGLRP